MFIWDPAIHPVDDLGIYCPAHDAVSETIVSHHIWEPRETVLAASALASSAPGAFFDFGAQIGWFTLLAASYGRTVHAIDADSDNLDLCAASVAVNEFSDRIHLHRARIGIDPFPVPPQHIRLAKIDVEGAENHVIELLRPALADGRIDHLLMEVSPVFADYYPALVASIIESGYDCFMLPPKHKPPLPLLPAATALAPYRLTATAALSLIPNMHQDDFWFARQGASW